MEVSEFYVPPWGVSGARILVGASADIQNTAVARIPDGVDGNVVKGEKCIVGSIGEFDSQDGAHCFRVRTLSGTSFVIPVAGQVQKFSSGSSVNVAYVLRNLGEEDIAIISPVGRGEGARFLADSCLEHDLKLALFVSAEGTTARTLTVRDPDGVTSTQLCVKPPYVVADSTLSVLKSCRPDTFVVTSLKPLDMELVEQMFKAGVGRYRVLSLHPQLLEARELRDRTLALTRQADLVQLNRREAGLLLGGRIFDPEDTKEVAQLLGANFTVVTLNSQGAVMCLERNYVVRHTLTRTMDGDPTGAGDVHLAVLVKALLLNHNPLSAEHALRVASWVAGQKVRQVGPWRGIPNASELERQIEQLRPFRAL